MHRAIRAWIVFSLVSILLATPVAAFAGMQGNSMCAVVIESCGCHMVPNGKGGCVPGQNNWMCPGGCWDLEPGAGKTIGQCIHINDCMGISAVDAAGNAVTIAKTAGDSGGTLSQIGTFMKENPLISGLAMGAGMSLLSSLMSPSGSSNSGDTSGTASNTYCASGNYYYTANPPAGDPCAVFSANGTGAGTTLPSSGADNTSIADLLKGLTGTTPSVTVNVPTPTTNTPTVSDLISSTGCATISSLISCQDGYKEQAQAPDSKGCPQPSICVPDTSGSTTPAPTGQTCGSGVCQEGSYCSTIQPGQCVPNGNVDCGSYSCAQGLACATDGTNQCNDPNASSTEVVPVADIIADPNNYQDNTNANTPDPSKTDLNQKQIPVPADGLHGDLLSFGGGATIYANNRSNNTEVSGFFGGSGVGSLCQARPWSSNFLSYIVPPAFFDNLCSLAGFQGGQGTAAGGTDNGQGTVRAVTGPAGPAYTPPAPQTGVFPVADIRASPASVNLGGRTTVFWTSHDVSSCEEASSDGNFTGSSTSGGASTVALSGPVTFMIRCLGVDGKYITDQVTVNIGI